MDDDKKVEVFLRCLRPQHKVFKMSTKTQKNILNFADLVSMLIIEEEEEHVFSLLFVSCRAELLGPKLRCKVILAFAFQIVGVYM